MPTFAIVVFRKRRSHERVSTVCHKQTERRRRKPIYGRLANVTPRWRDLVGYYTRFGDVRELVERVDDRYVIMNAGDELRLPFPVPPLPAAGWRRDFVLIGDGWEKDGDYNTSFSATVLPLPTHDRPNYEAVRCRRSRRRPGLPAAS